MKMDGIVEFKAKCMIRVEKPVLFDVIRKKMAEIVAEQLNSHDEVYVLSVHVDDVSVELPIPWKKETS